MLKIAFFTLMFTFAAHAETQLELGQRALHSMTGCYIVDYSYTETDGIKPGYVRDDRVYDVNIGKTVKEWIYAEDISATRTRLQHVIFVVDLDGTVREGSMLKHTGEDWQYDAPFYYEFTGPNRWDVKKPAAGLWTQAITHLDDGLRYQCAAAFNDKTAAPEWTCDTYAPIPGRETRDMGRKDYNTLQRSTHVIAYGNSWLERQANVKTIDDGNGTKTPLAKELGKTWYVRVPDTDCAEAQTYMGPRKAFWSFLRQVWDEVLIGDRPFVEIQPPGPARYVRMWDVEDEYIAKNLKDPAVRKEGEDKILGIIQDYRAK